MRITGGKARGIPIKTPKDRRVRPALDQVRESLFSSLGDAILDATVLDLFAGTGSYGLEALSRGAKTVTFIELERESAKNIKANVSAVMKSMNISPREVQTDIQCRNVLQWQPFDENFYDFIFADPPYSLLETIQEKLFSTAEQSLKTSGLLLLEAPGEFDFCPTGWQVSKPKKLKKGSPAIFRYTKNLG